jgi:hypothetical protein
MAAIRCTECGRDYSDSEIICPGCGAPRRSRSPSIIEIRGSGHPSRQFDLTGPECSIGTETSNALVLSDATVSRRHALIRRLSGSFQLVDLGSTNGTFINDRRMTGSANLSDGDRIGLGSAKFLFLEPAIGGKESPPRTRSPKVLSLLKGKVVQYVASGALIAALILGLYFASDWILVPSLDCESDASTGLLRQTLNKLLSEQLKGGAVSSISNIRERQEPTAKSGKNCRADVTLTLTAGGGSTKEMPLAYNISLNGSYETLKVVDQDLLINTVVLDCSSQQTADLLIRAINSDPDNGGMMTAVSVGAARDAAPELTESTHGKQRSCNAKIKVNLRNGSVSIEFPVSFNVWREGDTEQLQVNDRATLYEMNRGFP